MYPLLFRHVLTRFDPEFAHHLGMAVVRIAGLPPIAAVLRRFTRPHPTLAVDALGVRFPSPFGMAAGFDKDVVGAAGLEALGFGHIEVGTLTAVSQTGNPRPRLFRLVADRALINRMGFNNRGSRNAARRLARLRRGGAVIGVNIGKSRVVAVEDALEDYVASARMLAPLADYLAVNVSSPNTPGLRGLQAVRTLRPLLEAVFEASGSTPLLVKIAPDLPDEEVGAITELARDIGLAGLIATNTTIARDGLLSDPVTIIQAGEGGLSGAPLAERSLRVLELVRAAVPDPSFCVISVGGVTSAADVRSRLDAGASLVQGYSAFVYEGPLWAARINRELASARG